MPLLIRPTTNYPDIIAPYDLIPKVHLSNLAGQTSAVVDFIGDSTTTETDNPVDTSQTIFDAICAEMTRQNPLISFTFNNRGIGGTNWSDPMLTGTQLSTAGFVVPSWLSIGGSAAH